MTSPQAECSARPLHGTDHDGPLAEYVRICPRGHIRTGTACERCAGIGAVICLECPGDTFAPALLIAAGIWNGITSVTPTGDYQQLRNDLDDATRVMLDLGTDRMADAARAIRKRAGL